MRKVPAARRGGDFYAIASALLGILPLPVRPAPPSGTPAAADRTRRTRHAILNKPGPLDAEEMAIMRTHTVIGESLLKGMELYEKEPLLKMAAEICRWHHERYDGGGYPDGLTGDEIPISAQVVAVADAYDALTSKRSYKEAYSHERAIDMIKNGECGRFNPILIECLDDIRNEIKEDVLPENAKLNEDSVLRELK